MGDPQVEHLESAILIHLEEKRQLADELAQAMRIAEKLVSRAEAKASRISARAKRARVRLHAEIDGLREQLRKARSRRRSELRVLRGGK